MLIVGGFYEMEYDLLKECVDQKFSVEEISKLSGKSNGSVKYWLRKHNMKIIMGESERMRRAKTLSETMKNTEPINLQKRKVILQQKGKQLEPPSKEVSGQER
jgi:hypothetical protein